MYDTYWTDTAAFVKSCCAEACEIVAPGGFEQLVPCTSYSRRHECVSPKVLVLHKGQLEELGLDWIENATQPLHPSFANEVFVAFSDTKPMRSITDSPHFVAFKQKLAALVRHVEVGAQVSAPGARMAMYLGNNLALTKTIFGHKMYVDTRDLSLAPHILIDGYWEQWITNVFRQAIRPGMHVLDIGANVGWYSLLAAELVGPNGRLTSFEANPAMAELVHRNLVVNGFLDRARVETKAVYSVSKQLAFQVYEHFMGSSSLFATQEAAASFKDTLKTVQVDAVSLDDFMSPGSRVDFIKIDAEGAEPFILKGATRLFAENPQLQIMMEFSASILSQSYGSVGAFCSDIKALGFTIWRITHDSTLVESSREDLESAAHCDVILKR